MKYYKIIGSDTIIGVGSTYDFRRYQRKHNIIIVSDIDNLQYIQFDGKLYHDTWMSPTISDVPYELATIVEINETEYNTLLEAIETGEEIAVEEETQTEETPIVDENAEITLDYVKSMKIAEMSKTCNTIIESGFDAVMADGETHHFSLTTQDQLNLITLTTQLAAGETSIPYHADGELCRFFSQAEIQIIIESATRLKTYHITYFNMLKSYINQLTTIEEVSAVTYGMELAEEYQSDVMKYLVSV